ncbi:MAG: DUF502 domain-containing protein [Halobacteria archaeon]|nr:DUF502 domain-containing protein [Halobacteria archaeon]
MNSKIKRDLASGLVVLAPIAVTLYVALWLYNLIAALPGSEYFKLTGSALANEMIRVFVSVLVIILLLIIIGNLIRTAIGVVLQNWLDELANYLPGLRIIYNATKMAIDTVVGGTDEFQKPVKLDIEGLRMTAFKTGTTTDDGRDVIFLPTAPNITTGFVIEVEPDMIEETDDTVEEALTRILSAGFGDSKTEGSEQR